MWVMLPLVFFLDQLRVIPHYPRYSGNSRVSHCGDFNLGSHEPCAVYQQEEALPLIDCACHILEDTCSLQQRKFARPGLRLSNEASTTALGL